MRRQKKSTILIVLYFLSCISIYSNSVNKTEKYVLTEILDKDIILQLKNDTKIINNFTYRDEQNYFLCPKTELSSKSLDYWKENKEEIPSISLEALYLVEKNNKIENQKEVIQKILHSVSAMEGIKYYSNLKKKYETLYNESYIVDNLETRNKITDQIKSDVKTLYVVQHDNSFGKYASIVNYSDTLYENSFEYINKDDIYFTMIKAVENDDLRIFLNVIECDNEILIYLLIQVKANTIKLLDNILNQSFVSRMDALYSWFCQEYNKY